MGILSGNVKIRMKDKNKDITRIFYFRYQSLYEYSPNRWDKRSYSGLLLKLTDETGQSGYASYHSLSAFSDLEAQEMLLSLKENREESQLLKSYLHQDLQSRKLEMDALAGAFLIENHKLLLNFTQLNLNSLQVYVNEGFRIFKLKMGSNIEQESKWIQNLIVYFQNHKIKLRLDFNEALGFEEFDSWCNRYVFHQHGIIDYYEDPCVYDESQWTRWKDLGLCLAKDLVDCKYFEKTDFPGVQVLVLKPAKLNIVEWLKRLDNPNDYKYVVTHYMDSPLGVAQAVASAIRFKFFVKDRLITCGLLPVEQLQMPLVADVFKSHIKTSGPHLVIDGGLGLGYEKEMNSVNWQPL